MRAASSMDFQCATHVNPFSPGFRNSSDGWDDPQHAMEVHTATAVMISAGGGHINMDEKVMATSTSAQEEHYADAVDALNSHPPKGPVRNFSHKQQQPAYIETNTGLAMPEKAMTSPMPYSPDSYVTPSSTTSATPFLAAGQNSAFSPTSPRAAYSPHTSSPLVRQEAWEETRTQGRGGLLRSKASKTDVNAPVATRQLQTTFPPPPTR